MKKPLLSIFTIVLMGCGSAFSQTILTASGINPVSGEILKSNVANYVSPGSAGANQNWNLSAMTSTAAQNNTVGSVASTPYAASFPNANLQYNDGSVFQYFNANANAFQIAGLYGSNTTFIYSDLEDVLHFPFAYQSTYTDTWASSFTSNSIPFARSGSTTVTYDGYGTVITPAGTFNNAVRVHYVQDYKDVTQFGTFTYLNDQYMWYANGYHAPVASVFSLTSTVTNVTGGTYLTPNTSVGLAAESQSGQSHIMSFPNPASSSVYFSAKDDRITSLTLYTFEGKLLYSKDIPEGELVTIDVRDLSEGIYMARVSTVNGKVETKKINVVK